MVAYKDYVQEVLFNWFQKAPSWQKDMFCAIWNGANDENHLVKRAIMLIDQEYISHKTTVTSNTTFPDNIDFTEGHVVPIVLKSISDIKGVGALAANSPLEFGDGLTVVYGENGCGKSSYVRILKAAVNPEYASAVIGNVFATDVISAGATIMFSLDGAEHLLRWDKTNKDKYPILIYDNDIAHQFVDKENEVVYEPKVLSIISKMANAFAQVSTYYQNVYENTEKKYTQKPKDIEYQLTIQEFNRITTMHDIEQLEKNDVWNSTTEAELAAVAKSLQVSEPEKVAKALEAQKRVIQEHGHNVLSLLSLVCDESCKIYLDKRQKQIKTKEIADELILTSRSKSILIGFGSNSWKTMWSAAVDYVVETEEISSEVPVTKDGLCALCQQVLNADAKSRLQSFNEFVASKAITDAETAFCDFQNIVGTLQNKIENVISISAIETALISNAIAEDIREVILDFYRAITNRCRWLLEYNNDTEEVLPAISLQENIISEFKEIVTKMDTQIKALNETVQNREKQINRKQELLSFQWIHENIAVKKQLIILTTIQSRCKTNSITALKKDLSDILITDAYMNRFSSEMIQLDASKRIKVELVSKGAKRGGVFRVLCKRFSSPTNCQQ